MAIENPLPLDDVPKAGDKLAAPDAQLSASLIPPPGSVKDAVPPAANPQEAGKDVVPHLTIAGPTDASPNSGQSKPGSTMLDTPPPATQVAELLKPAPLEGHVKVDVVDKTTLSPEVIEALKTEGPFAWVEVGTKTLLADQSVTPEAGPGIHDTQPPASKVADVSTPADATDRAVLSTEGPATQVVDFLVPNVGNDNAAWKALEGATLPNQTRPPVAEKVKPDAGSITPEVALVANPGDAAAWAALAAKVVELNKANSGSAKGGGTYADVGVEVFRKTTITGSDKSNVRYEPVGVLALEKPIPVGSSVQSPGTVPPVETLRPPVVPAIYRRGTDATVTPVATTVVGSYQGVGADTTVGPVGAPVVPAIYHGRTDATVVQTPATPGSNPAGGLFTVAGHIDITQAPDHPPLTGANHPPFAGTTHPPIAGTDHPPSVGVDHPVAPVTPVAPATPPIAQAQTLGYSATLHMRPGTNETWTVSAASPTPGQPTGTGPFRPVDEHGQSQRQGSNQSDNSGLGGTSQTWIRRSEAPGQQQQTVTVTFRPIDVHPQNQPPRPKDQEAPPLGTATGAPGTGGPLGGPPGGPLGGTPSRPEGVHPPPADKSNPNPPPIPQVAQLPPAAPPFRHPPEPPPGYVGDDRLGHYHEPGAPELHPPHHPPHPEGTVAGNHPPTEPRPYERPTPVEKPIPVSQAPNPEVRTVETRAKESQLAAAGGLAVEMAMQQRSLDAARAIEAAGRASSDGKTHQVDLANDARTREAVTGGFGQIHSGDSSKSMALYQVPFAGAIGVPPPYELARLSGTLGNPDARRLDTSPASTYQQGAPRDIDQGAIAGFPHRYTPEQIANWQRMRAINQASQDMFTLNAFQRLASAGDLATSTTDQAARHAAWQSAHQWAYVSGSQTVGADASTASFADARMHGFSPDFAHTRGTEGAIAGREVGTAGNIAAHGHFSGASGMAGVSSAISSAPGTPGAPGAVGEHIGRAVGTPEALSGKHDPSGTISPDKLGNLDITDKIASIHGGKVHQPGHSDGAADIGMPDVLAGATLGGLLGRGRDDKKNADTKSDGKVDTTNPGVTRAGRLRYVVKAGDTLESISRKYFNDEKFAGLILAINQAVIKRRTRHTTTVISLRPNSIILIPTPKEAAIYKAELAKGAAPVDAFEYDEAPTVATPESAAKYTLSMKSCPSCGRATFEGNPCPICDATDSEFSDASKRTFYAPPSVLPEIIRTQSGDTIRHLTEQVRVARTDNREVSPTSFLYSERLEVAEKGEWTTLITYLVYSDFALRLERQMNEEKHPPFRIDLPQYAVQQLCENDFQHNWPQYYQNFVAGRPIIT